MSDVRLWRKEVWGSSVEKGGSSDRAVTGEVVMSGISKPDS